LMSCANNNALGAGWSHESGVPLFLLRPVAAGSASRVALQLNTTRREWGSEEERPREEAQPYRSGCGRSGGWGGSSRCRPAGKRLLIVRAVGCPVLVIRWSAHTNELRSGLLSNSQTRLKGRRRSCCGQKQYQSSSSRSEVSRGNTLPAPEVLKQRTHACLRQSAWPVRQHMRYVLVHCLSTPKQLRPVK
jgi:hypothetical protein